MQIFQKLSRLILLLCLVILIGGCKDKPTKQSDESSNKLSIQEIVALISIDNYQEIHLEIESMGLGLYGGPEYDMGYRNRDYHMEQGPTPGNQEASMYIEEMFTAFGLDVSLQGSYKNVVGELSGRLYPEKIYIIGAHFDHVEGDRPGADDNASGTAAVIEAARVLSQYQFESTIRFICFNAEEDGLRGSKDYVMNHVLPNNENILGMINLDLILRPGSDVNPSTVIDAEVETQKHHRASVAWVKLFQQAVNDYVPNLIVDDSIIYGVSSSDNDPFLNNDIPAFLVIENSDPDWARANPYIHTFEDATDRLANDPTSPGGVIFDFAFATDVTKGAVALLTQEAVPLKGSDLTE